MLGREWPLEPVSRPVLGATLHAGHGAGRTGAVGRQPAVALAAGRVGAWGEPVGGTGATERCTQTATLDLSASTSPPYPGCLVMSQRSPCLRTRSSD